MKFTILTLFPEFFSTPFSESILKRAQAKTDEKEPSIEISTLNIRDFATDKHKMTDDHPYGGGPGMVMKVEPIDLALQNVKKSSKKTLTILTSAKGQMFTQQKAVEYSKYDELIIICGHYEGVDERVAEHLIDEEIRIGDYVMTGGEPAAIVIVDAVTRLLPNVLGNELSTVQESHSEPGYLEHPQYTRPEEYKGWKVPEILLSGHHAKIEEWKKEK
ncbi:MAG: tRNA (guanosine(37)-N1)-methyltransferase TrmD [Patescibacteria group bacterium]